MTNRKRNTNRYPVTVYLTDQEVRYFHRRVASGFKSESAYIRWALWKDFSAHLGFSVDREELGRVCYFETVET